jgi:hypothetical protein
MLRQLSEMLRKLIEMDKHRSCSICSPLRTAAQP